MKTVPWTDAKGLQEEYPEAVTEWCNLHDLLDDTDSNKMVPKLRGPILKSQCYSRAKDLAKSIPIGELNSENGATCVVSSIHKRDALSFVTDIYNDFNRL